MDNIFNVSVDLSSQKGFETVSMRKIGRESLKQKVLQQIIYKNLRLQK